MLYVRFLHLGSGDNVLALQQLLYALYVRYQLGAYELAPVDWRDFPFPILYVPC